MLLKWTPVSARRCPRMVPSQIRRYCAMQNPFKLTRPPILIPWLPLICFSVSFQNDWQEGFPNDWILLHCNTAPLLFSYSIVWERDTAYLYTNQATRGHYGNIPGWGDAKHDISFITSICRPQWNRRLQNKENATSGFCEGKPKEKVWNMHLTAHTWF